MMTIKLPCAKCRAGICDRCLLDFMAGKLVVHLEHERLQRLGVAGEGDLKRVRGLPEKSEMTQRRRFMMLELAEGDISHPVLPILRILDDHVRCDEMLHWLIKTGISGRDVALMVRVSI